MKRVLVLVGILSFSLSAQAQIMSSFVDDFWNNVLSVKKEESNKPVLMSSTDNASAEKKAEKVKAVEPVAKKVAKKKKVVKKKAIVAKAEPEVVEKEVTDSVTTQEAAPALETKTTTTLTQSAESTLDKISTRIVLGSSTDFRRDTDGDKTSGLSVEAHITYRFNADYRLTLSAIGEKQLTQGREALNRDSRLSLALKSYKFFNDKLILAPSVAGVIPTSEDSRKRDELRTALDLSPALAYSLSDTVTLTYLPRFRKFFHKFKTSKNDKVLVDYSLIQVLGVGYSATEKISLGASLLYVSSWSYRGTKRADSYNTVFDLGYAYSKSLLFNVGILTGGSVIDNEVGADQNIELFNERTSTAYLSASLLF